jgi:murein L,D-transpeptidase YcbB/YkuD
MSGARPNQYAPLARKLPVFILYLTAFMRDGELYFGNDLYARDGDLVNAMAPGALPDARTRTALDRLAQLAKPMAAR